MRRVGEHATPGAPEQPPECNAQWVGRAQGVNNSAWPRVGADGARGSLDPNRQVGLARGVALRQEACPVGGAYPRVGG